MLGNQLDPAPFLVAGAELQLVPAGIAFSRWGLFGAAAAAGGSLERHALALWEILAQLGVSPGVVGLAGGDAGRRRESLSPSRRASSPARPGQVSPPELEPQAASRSKSRATSSTPALAQRFRRATAGRGAARALSQDLWRERLAAALLDREPRTQRLFLRLPGLRQVARRWFGGYVAHDLEGEQAARAAEAARRVEAYYRHLDDYLGALWARAARRAAARRRLALRRRGAERLAAR